MKMVSLLYKNNIKILIYIIKNIFSWNLKILYYNEIIVLII